MTGRLEGKVALISGAAQGIGASFAALVIAEGGRVVIGDILDDKGASTAESLGDAALFVHLDVSDAQQWEAAVASTLDAFGRLDVLVNNAAIENFGTIEEYAIDRWERMIAINLSGVFYGMKAAIPALRESGRGSIVNISSVAGLQGVAGLGAYTAAKFGVRGLTRTAAIELAPDNIRVNSVHPGLVRTAMTAGYSEHQPSVPLGRWAEPDEVGHLLVYLASDESSFSTGGEFLVDGGMMAGTKIDLMRD